MATKWSAHNGKVVKVLLRHQLGSTIMPLLSRSLGETASAVVSKIDSGFAANDKQFPTYTKNMRDGTGLAVYFNGTTQGYAPVPKATKPQKKNIVGQELLRQAISNGSARFSKGAYIVLYSAVPYATYVNAVGSPKFRGKDFFNVLGDTLMQQLLDKLKVLGKVSTV